MLVCVAAVALGLGGCSGSGDEGTSAGQNTLAGQNAAAGQEAPAEEVAADGKGVDAERAKALCAHLEAELPRIQAVGSEVGAMAQLAMSLAGFYEDHPKELDGTVLDAQVAQECPDTGATMLKAAGIKSFSDL